MEYSLSSAAKVTGSSKSLIHRMCEDGRLSHRRLPNGQYRIDASELGRAFSGKNQVTVLEPLGEDAEAPARGGSIGLAALRMELAVARAKTQALEEQLGRERQDREHERETHQETVSDLRRRLDQEQEERRTLQRQLMSPIHSMPQVLQKQPAEVPTKVEPVKSPRSFLARLLGRAAS